MAKDYEIVPEDDFESLKKDIDNIKKDPIGNTAEGKDLKESIDNLNVSITNLFNLFKTTAEDLKTEEKENELVANKIGPLFEQVKSLTDQNEKIAKGIVALAEMVEELKNKQPSSQMPKEQNIPSFEPRYKPKNEPLYQSSGFNEQSFSEPSFDMGSGPQPLPRTNFPEMPAPPEQKNKKKSLFGF